MEWRKATVVDLVVKRNVSKILTRAREEAGTKIISPEDLIIQKLQMVRTASKRSGLFQDREDVRLLLKIHKKTLDWVYLRREAGRRGVLRLLKTLAK